MLLSYSLLLLFLLAALSQATLSQTRTMTYKFRGNAGRRGSFLQGEVCTDGVCVPFERGTPFYQSPEILEISLTNKLIKFIRQTIMMNE